MSTRRQHMVDAAELAAITEAAERTAQRVERVIWLVTALAIGCPLGWWLAEWLTCEVC